MSLVNWRRRQDRIEEVFVPESALAEGDHPRHLPMYISYCVSHALQSGLYLRDELPREALIASTLGDYLGEVDNGGHAQFVGNICWCEEHRSDIREGLAILGLDEAARIFSDLETFAKRTPKRFARSHGEAHEQESTTYKMTAAGAAAQGNVTATVDVVPELPPRRRAVRH
ncbi:MAG TPA: hypothetical protein VE974_10400 [Thermoanaerobaculia bacterium]|nr:hypothetical protein [Thermoanaerobaculia bacterium]